MTITCFFGQRGHHETFLGRRQCVPLFRPVFEHDLVLLVVYDHSVASLIVNAEQRTGLISTPIDQVHVDRLPFLGDLPRWAAQPCFVPRQCDHRQSENIGRILERWDRRVHFDEGAASGPLLRPQLNTSRSLQSP